MVDRAALAGMALGVGVLLIAQQVFANSPSWALLAIGIFVFVIGAIVWSDLRENFTRHWTKVEPARFPVDGPGFHSDHLHIAGRSDHGDR